ncbi:DUF4352 domain-containing protein [Paenibacillus zanthoxyli]|uniref:DUF4352 domain-containing protein n=1 Tax=Paenibacillus zanthoxyli TaxID=369399 RepID=UPI00046F71F1|nr:DUF4352 domain-containing protein [Paenibacillus zanthoxyli]
MKKIFKIGCLGFIALIVLGVIITMFSPKEDKKTATSTTNPSAVATDSTKEKAENTAKEEKKLASIGEELKVGDVVFKVNKMSTAKKIEDGQFLSYSPESEGSVFLIVNVTVKNTGNEMITTDSSYFQLMKGEIKYTPSTLISTSDKFFMYDGINPGLSQTGNVVFEIPENLNDFVLNVQTGFWGTEQGQIELKK